MIRNKEIEIIKHTIITFSLSTDGNLVRDEHLSKNDKGYHRLGYRVKNFEKYVEKDDGNVIDWDSVECKNDFLAKHNIDVYKYILKTSEEYHLRFETFKHTTFAQNIFKYFELVKLEYENWFLENAINLYKEDTIEDYLIEKKSNTNSILHNQFNPPSSKIDADKDLINNCISYINSEIDKLGKVYKKGRVIEICTAAYEKIIPNNKTKKSVSVTDFSKAIYPRIKHRFNDWKEPAFFKYLSQNTSPKVKK